MENHSHTTQFYIKNTNQNIKKISVYEFEIITNSKFRKYHIIYLTKPTQVQSSLILKDGMNKVNK